jgi:ABC-type spermidine/putrescine transport system permease subunit I
MTTTATASDSGPNIATMREQSDRWVNLALSTPAILTIAVVVFLPILWLGWMSFFNAAGQLTTENYARIWESDLYLETFIITFKISLTVTVLCALLGYPLAYTLTRLPSTAAAIGMICVLIPFWTAILVRTYAWLVLLQRKGVINSILLQSGLIEEPLQLAHNMTGSIIGMVHVMLPFLVLPVYATMKSIDQDLLRASQSMGASPTESFWRVFFPMSLPGLFAGVVMVFVLSLGFFTTPALLGGGRVQMLAQRIESSVTLYANWGAASALGVVLIVIAFACIALLNKVFGLDRLFVK